MTLTEYEKLTYQEKLEVNCKRTTICIKTAHELLDCTLHQLGKSNIYNIIQVLRQVNDKLEQASRVYQNSGEQILNLSVPFWPRLQNPNYSDLCRSLERYADECGPIARLMAEEMRSDFLPNESTAISQLDLDDSAI